MIELEESMAILIRTLGPLSLQRFIVLDKLTINFIVLFI